MDYSHHFLFFLNLIHHYSFGHICSQYRNNMLYSYTHVQLYDNNSCTSHYIYYTSFCLWEYILYLHKFYPSHVHTRIVRRYCILSPYYTGTKSLHICSLSNANMHLLHHNNYFHKYYILLLSYILPVHTSHLPNVSMHRWGHNNYFRRYYILLIYQVHNTPHHTKLLHDADNYLPNNFLHIYYIHIFHM